MRHGLCDPSERRADDVEFSLFVLFLLLTVPERASFAYLTDERLMELCQRQSACLGSHLGPDRGTPSVGGVSAREWTIEESLRVDLSAWTTSCTPGPPEKIEET